MFMFRGEMAKRLNLLGLFCFLNISVAKSGSTVEARGSASARIRAKSSERCGS